MTNQPEKLAAALASDHGGFGLKNFLAQKLTSQGYQVVDLGCNSAESVDYPDYAAQVAEGVRAGTYAFGVLVCGTGLGMSMTANRFPGVRAAVCTTGYMARMARAHNDANILCLGERVVGQGQAEAILNEFLQQDFEGSRHQRRIDKIDSLTSR